MLNPGSLPSCYSSSSSCNSHDSCNRHNNSKLSNSHHSRVGYYRSKKRLTLRPLDGLRTLLPLSLGSTWRMFILLLLFSSLTFSTAEYVKNFKITEGVQIGSRIGFIGETEPGRPKPPSPPYLVVPSADSPIDEDLDIDQNTGEVRTNVELDREKRARYRFSAIPLSGEGENIKVNIEVEDQNDNSPTFSQSKITIGLPENSPKDSKRRLPPAVDADLGIFNTQRYEIISGNRQNSFRLSTQRDKDGRLMLDLIVNGFLDREVISSYTLSIEAQDGGNPTRKGLLTVEINILDLNDNAPVFKEQRYYASIPENSTVGSEIITVSALDPDEGPNGDVTYSINRRQSDNQELFAIDTLSGLLTVNKRLDFESKDQHELVVVAKDNGDVPQETTAFITVKITDINDNQPKINAVYRTPTGRPELREDALIGQKIADITVTDPDEPTQIADFDVTLSGSDMGYFSLERQRSGYSLVLARRIDREETDKISLTLEALDDGFPPLRANLELTLRILDVNDNSPVFDSVEYEGSIQETATPGTSILRVLAEDQDTGENSRINYRLENSALTHSDWFTIDSETGLISTRTKIDCEIDPEPILVVVATDNGNPRRSSSATVRIGVEDVNDNEPRFDSVFYNVSLKESVESGTCFIRVNAEDSDCGVTSKVSYRLGEVEPRFRVDQDTGEICLQTNLDFETDTFHHLTIVAVDRGGLSSTSMVGITVEDDNDNSPQFNPREYSGSVEGEGQAGDHILRVSAVDRDSGVWGQVTYSISKGNKEGLFLVDEKEGVLSLARSLKDAQGTFKLEVSAVDGGGTSAPQPALLSINIAPQDTPSTPPLCIEKLHQFSIEEDAIIRSDVGKVRTNVKNPRIFFYPENAQSHFDIDSQSGLISTKMELDHETNPRFLLNIGVEDDVSGMTGYCQVLVNIIDINDNAPSFGPTLGLITIPENSPAHTLVFAKQARDRDSGENGRVNYRIIKDTGVFTVDENTGVVTTLQELDYEQMEQHEVQLVAYDNGSPSLSSSFSINILVQDENDHAPVFSKPSYQLTVEETLPKDSQLLPLDAEDLDGGKNGRLRFSIIDESEYISILPTSGILYLSKELDYETINSISFTVKVEDEGTPPLSDVCSVDIRVVDSNDNAPIFSKEEYSYIVEENTGVGYKIGVIQATDADSGQNGDISYKFKRSTDVFQIDEKNGEIRTVVNLDREVEDEYILEVEAVDSGIPRLTSSATLHIQVEDLNDNAPVIVDPVETVLSVQGGAPPGTPIARILATDPDLADGGNLVYTIDNDGGAGYAVLSIHPTTGLLSTSSLLEYNPHNITVTVRVQDQGSPSLSSKVWYTVNILRERETSLPFAQKNLILQVSETATPGSRVGSVKPNPTNLDLSIAWFSISGGNEDGMFDIDNYNGILVVLKPLRFSSRKEFNLRVSLNDEVYGMSREIIKVKIIITDVNGISPIFSTSPLELNVPENTAIGTPIQTIKAKGMDSAGNGTIRYSLLEQFPQNFFRIDSLSGELYLIHELDFESTEKVFMTLRATDSAFAVEGRKTSDVSVIVHVEDTNDHVPAFVSTKRKEIQEGIDIGVPFHRVLAVDGDSKDAGDVSYLIEGGNSDNVFHLDASTGLLSIKERPTRSSYQLTIKAEDSGVPRKSSSQILQIGVVEQSNGPPKFTQNVYRAEVMEHSEPGTLVIAVQADKQGSGSDIIYSMDTSVSRGLFRIDERSGDIVTMGDLDREERNEYIVTVYVHDSNTQPNFDTATVLIKISDENDKTPRFVDSCNPLFVPENTDLSALHYFIAVDEDEGPNGEITYSIVGGDEGNKFSLDAHTGQLSAAPLDHEEHSSYSLTIKAEDQGNPRRSSTCETTIRVIDRNDNDPVFLETKYKARISENVDVGTPVMSVTATDADSGQNAKISYSIQNGTEWIFGIDKDTGEIYTTARLDREKNEEYNLLIMAVDEGIEDTRMASTTVSITLQDENDNEPEFDEYPFMAQILPEHPVGSQITKVTAKDKDKGQNANLKYSFLNQEDAEKFSIDAVTGIISSQQNLVTDDGGMFHIEILVTDGGTPSLSSTGLVEIKIGQQPSVQLNFQQKLYESQISEESKIGEDILQVQAVRSDGRIQRVIYTFGQGNQDGIFEINSNNGLIRLKNPQFIDYERKQEYKVTVLGHAAGQEQLYAYAECKIRVKDVNDNEPRFTQNVYFARAWEGNNKGTFVTQVMAVDGDSIENERLYYQIIDGNHDGAFTIDQQYSGIIKTNIVLDREIRDSYELKVTATDEGSPPKTGYTKVIVKIIDINDNQPQFPPSTPITISEGTVAGTRIGTIQANDIDSHPHLTYSFVNPSPGSSINPSESSVQTSEFFSIDKFSGVISLAKKVDREATDRFIVEIAASDGAHTVQTSVEILIEDENDSAPVFEKQVYTGVFSSNMTLPAPMVSVRAEDKDSGRNGEVKYKLIGSDIGYIDENGTIYVNNTSDIEQGTEIHLVVSAEDLGSPPQQSFVSVRLLNLQHSETSPQFHQQEFAVIIDPSAKIGSKLANLEVPFSGGNLFYSLAPGSNNPYVELDSSTGTLILKKRIDDPKLIPKTLDATLRRDNRIGDETSASIILNLGDLADSADLFERKYYDVNLSENTGTGKEIFGVPGPQLNYHLRIASGNINDTFELSSVKAGSLLLKKSLNYETQKEYKLILLGTIANRFDILTVVVKVLDENDNSPFFPVNKQIHSIKENSSPGSLVFVAQAQDLDISDSLHYSINSDEFTIGETNGRVLSKRVFDYETEQEFNFNLMVTDSAGAKASADVIIKIESVDEYYPAFESPSYQFTIDRLYPAEHILGRVKAVDQDAGASGRVVYSLASNDGYFKVDADTGEILVSRNLDMGLVSSDLGSNRQFQDVNYLVYASTGREDSLKTSTLVIFQVKIDILPPAPLPSTESGIATWGQGLIIAFVFILVIVGAGIFFFKRFSVNKFIQKRLIDPSSPAGLPYTNSINDTSTMDSTVPMSQYPPQYSDIVSQYGHSHGKSGQTRPGRLTQSELSEQSHRSASSGRGSAEDGEEEVDHEIQMINGAGLPTLNDTCIAEDSMSDISVQNGKEYLARLGIDTRPPHLSHTSSYQTLEGHQDLYNRLQDTDALSEKNSMVSGNNSVYARTGHPVSMTGSISSMVHSEEEVAGSYNWDYLLDWGPQYQPLQHVFQEISSLKDEGSQSVGIHVPPLLTSLPPRHAHSVSTHPRSPVSQEMLLGSALSPNFLPALSPLATRSPSISPLGPMTGPVRGVTRTVQQPRYQSSLHSDYAEAAENELRI